MLSLRYDKTCVEYIVRLMSVEYDIETVSSDILKCLAYADKEHQTSVGTSENRIEIELCF